MFTDTAGHADATTSSSTCSTWAPSGRRRRPATASTKGDDRKTGELRWTGTRVDLIFGSQLAAAGAGRGLCLRRCQAEVREATSSRPGPR
ncbi:MAG: hypothetical protein MZV49_03305 [Rhodopseudomonas palustris]|nr:hypothetical protein [Rhodopseudomonas palustris]